MSTLPGLRVNYARILTHYMTFTLKQQGEVLKKFVHQSWDKPLQTGFQRFILENSVKVDFAPTFPSFSLLFSLSVLSQVWYPPRSKVQGAFFCSVGFYFTLGENKRIQECQKE